MNDTANNWNFVYAAFIVAWVVILFYHRHAFRALRRARARYARAEATRKTAS